MTTRSVTALLVCAGALLGRLAAGAEPFVPERPKDIDKVIDLGNEVGKMIDKMPDEGDVAQDEDAGPRLYGGRTAASWAVMMVANAVGAAMFIYGRKQMKIGILVTGLALIVLPYVVVDAVSMLLVCVLVCAMPWGVKWAGIGR